MQFFLKKFNFRTEECIFFFFFEEEKSPGRQGLYFCYGNNSPSLGEFLFLKKKTKWRTEKFSKKTFTINNGHTHYGQVL